MGTLETVIILGVVLVGGYWVLTSGVLQNLGGVAGGGVFPAAGGETTGGIIGEIASDVGWEKKGCCRCKAHPTDANQIQCKQGTEGEVYIGNEEGDLDTALDECQEKCIETGEEDYQKLKCITENCCEHKETGMHCWREGVGEPLTCVKGSCDDAEQKSQETQGGKVANPTAGKTCPGKDTCNTVKGGYKKCTCDCIGDSWQMGQNSPCSQCETACRARRRQDGYASGVVYTGYGPALADSIKFSMLGRQAARAFVAVPQSMDYAYSPNNYDPFQLETGSMRISGV